MPSVELANVSVQGFWLLWNGEEHFLAFEDFPWFRDASIAALSNIELQGAEHLQLKGSKPFSGAFNAQQSRGRVKRFSRMKQANAKEASILRAGRPGTHCATWT